jgi:hypothetical protein
MAENIEQERNATNNCYDKTTTLPIEFLGGLSANKFRKSLEFADWRLKLLQIHNLILRNIDFKVPKHENFSIAFFALSEPIWVCDVGTAKEIEFLYRLTPDFDGFGFFAAY